MTAPKKYLYTIPDDPNHSASKAFLWIEKGQDVLEVGCASGIQTRFLKERLGCRVTGIEIDPLTAEDARPFCESLIVGNIDELELVDVLGKRAFDVITFIDVLEHLREPAAALRKVRPFLRQGGSVIASIPNIAHAAICWELAHGRFDYQNFGLLDNTHIRFFTRKNVARLFEEAGYRIASWDRVIKTPRETEFGVHCGSAQDQSFLDWICEINPEAHTYQFMVRAVSANVDSVESSYRHLATLDIVHQLEAELGELSLENRGLRSQVAWLEKRRFGPFTGLISRLRSAWQRRH